MNAHFDDPLFTFLISFECLDTAGRYDAIAREVMETGGTYTHPASADPWASHMHEIKLHGVIGLGDTADQAIRSWSKAAARKVGLCSAETDLPYPNPRNHGEEIANARAVYRKDHRTRQLNGGLL